MIYNFFAFSIVLLSLQCFANSDVNLSQVTDRRTKRISVEKEGYRFECPLDLRHSKASNARGKKLEKIKQTACDEAGIQDRQGENIEELADIFGLGRFETIGDKKILSLRDDHNAKRYSRGKYQIIYGQNDEQCGYEHDGIRGHGGMTENVAAITDGSRTVIFAASEIGSCGDVDFIIVPEDFEIMVKTFEFLPLKQISK